MNDLETGPLEGKSADDDLRRLEGGPIRRMVFLGAGMGFVGIAAIGAFLPVLPTTPFLLLASYFFVRSSPRLNDWLLRNRLFGPLLRDWHEKKGVRLHVKVSAIAALAIVVSLSLASGRLPPVALGVLVALAAIGLGVILWLPLVKD